MPETTRGHPAAAGGAKAAGDWRTRRAAVEKELERRRDGRVAVAWREVLTVADAENIHTSVQRTRATDDRAEENVLVRARWERKASDRGWRARSSTR